jgi:hypothetical protein
MEEHREHVLEGMNPVTAIIGAIVIAAAMVVVTFTVFVNSTAYATVKQIQIGTKIVQTLSSDIDTKSPIKADDITQYQKSVEQRTATMDDASDFANADLSDQALGLTAQQQ